MFEISDGLKVYATPSGRTVWHTECGLGAGIIVSSSRRVEVYDNVVAWNGDGNLSHRAGSGNRDWVVTDVYVHDNIVASANACDRYHSYALGWLSDLRRPQDPRPDLQ